MSDKKKKLPIVLGIIGGVILILVIAIYFLVFRSVTPSGSLATITGAVQVDKGSGWTAAEDGMELKESYKIKTFQGSSAKIILQDTIIVTLKENTEISLKEIADDNVILQQESGTIWNKFMKITGVKQYNVETPTTVATVRGTMFKSEMFNSIISLLVAEGVVDFSDEDEEKAVEAGHKMISENGTLYPSNITKEEQAEIYAMMASDLEAMKELRLDMIQRDKARYNQIKALCNLDDAGVLEALADIDSGVLDDSELIAKSPVQIPILNKLKALDDAIKSQMKAIDQMKARLR